MVCQAVDCPLNSKRCVSCSAQIRASWCSVVMVVAFPMMTFVVGNLLASGHSLEFDLWLATVGATFGLVAVFFVPLVRRDT